MNIEPYTKAYKAYEAGKKAAKENKYNNPFNTASTQCLKGWYDKGFYEEQSKSAKGK
jgi:hypothetical protein